MAERYKSIAPKDLGITRNLGNIITWEDGGELKRISLTDLTRLIESLVLNTGFVRYTEVSETEGILKLYYADKSRPAVEIYGDRLEIQDRATGGNVFSSRTDLSTMKTVVVVGIEGSTRVEMTDGTMNLFAGDNMTFNGRTLPTLQKGFANGATVEAQDSTLYTATEAIGTLTITDGTLTTADKATWALSFDTASSGAITVTFPSDYKFAETPVFGNNEHWEIAIRKGYVVFTKYDLA